MGDKCPTCDMEWNDDEEHEGWHESLTSIRTGRQGMIDDVNAICAHLTAPVEEGPNFDSELVIRAEALAELSKIWGRLSRLVISFDDPDQHEKCLAIVRQGETIRKALESGDRDGAMEGLIEMFKEAYINKEKSRG